MRTLFAPLSMASLLSLSLVACSSSPPPAPAPSPTPVATATVAEAPVKVVDPPPPPAPVAPTPVLTYTGAFATPESVYYDEANDRYLVSNINGTPVAVDNNGYISVLSPDGQIVTPKWIEGGAKKVTLNAPKGMAIVKGVLYVVDISTVRMFDAKSGAPKGEIKLAGATFANDIAVGADGKIYVSDSGLTMEGADFKPTGADAVWVIEKGKAKPLAKSTDLGKPNGLFVDGKTLWVVTFGSNELYSLDDKGTKSEPTKLATGGLDGIVKVGDRLLVSSWDGSQVFAGKPGEAFEVVFETLEAPADIGYDGKRNRLLVPRFMEDRVEVYDIAPK